MFRRIALVAFALFLSIPVLAKPVDPVSGIWHITFTSVDDGEKEMEMRLRLSGETVSGTTGAGKKAVSVFDGTWRNGTLVLVLGSSKKKTWYLTLRGTMQTDGTIAGTVEVYDDGARSSGTFEARR